MLRSLTCNKKCRTAILSDFGKVKFSDIAPAADRYQDWVSDKLASAITSWSRLEYLFIGVAC